jgi:hypothetical protein
MPSRTRIDRSNHQGWRWSFREKVEPEDVSVMARETAPCMREMRDWQGRKNEFRFGRFGNRACRVSPSGEIAGWGSNEFRNLSRGEMDGRTNFEEIAIIEKMWSVRVLSPREYIIVGRIWLCCSRFRMDGGDIQGTRATFKFESLRAIRIFPNWIEGFIFAKLPEFWI